MKTFPKVLIFTLNFVDINNRKVSQFTKFENKTFATCVQSHACSFPSILTLAEINCWTCWT